MRELTIQVPEAMKTVERKVILETLEHFEGNRTNAAMALGISIRGLRNKITEYKQAGFEVHAPSPPSWAHCNCKPADPGQEAHG